VYCCGLREFKGGWEEEEIGVDDPSRFSSREARSVLAGIKNAKSEVRATNQPAPTIFTTSRRKPRRLEKRIFIEFWLGRELQVSLHVSHPSGVTCELIFSPF
jgi:hypothetical protein